MSEIFVVIKIIRQVAAAVVQPLRHTLFGSPSEMIYGSHRLEHLYVDHPNFSVITTFNSFELSSATKNRTPSVKIKLRIFEFNWILY